jgi:hypothetical protein
MEGPLSGEGKNRGDKFFTLESKVANADGFLSLTS